jgi:hypothetical protein
VPWCFIGSAVFFQGAGNLLVITAAKQVQVIEKVIQIINVNAIIKPLGQ